MIRIALLLLLIVGAGYISFSETFFESPLAAVSLDRLAGEAFKPETAAKSWVAIFVGSGVVAGILCMLASVIALLVTGITMASKKTVEAPRGPVLDTLAALLGLYAALAWPLLAIVADLPGGGVPQGSGAPEVLANWSALRDADFGDAFSVPAAIGSVLTVVAAALLFVTIFVTIKLPKMPARPAASKPAPAQAMAAAASPASAPTAIPTASIIEPAAQAPTMSSPNIPLGPAPATQPAADPWPSTPQPTQPQMQAAATPRMPPTGGSPGGLWHQPTQATGTAPFPGIPPHIAPYVLAGLIGLGMALVVEALRYEANKFYMPEYLGEVRSEMRSIRSSKPDDIFDSYETARQTVLWLWLVVQGVAIAGALGVRSVVQERLGNQTALYASVAFLVFVGIGSWLTWQTYLWNSEAQRVADDLSEPQGEVLFKQFLITTFLWIPMFAVAHLGQIHLKAAPLVRLIAPSVAALVIGIAGLWLLDLWWIQGG